MTATGAPAPSSTHRLTAALFAGGVATFAELYAVQAVLPALAAEFSLSESTASLAVSVATGALALSVLPWAFVGDRVGRARAMRWAAVAAAVCATALPFAPSFGVLLALRAVSGVALGALPALAMAHLVARAEPARVAAIGGLYIAGTTIGGLSGRVVTGAVAAGWGWRWGVAVTAVLVAVAVAVFVVLSRGDDRRQPRSRATPSGGPPVTTTLGAGARLRAAFTDRTVAVFYAQAFLLMGGFVTIYNLLGFRLLDEPYRLPASVVSLLFLTYLVGTVGSSGVGRAVGRFGRRRVLVAAGFAMAGGVALTLAPSLWLIIAGLVVATFAFFPAHAIAASWAGERIPGARSQVAATYSLAYYAGSSLVGFAGAAVYDRGGWTGAMAVVITGCVVAASIAAIGAPRR
ncbi:MFS transporter [Nakamurella flava]|uniref:MFS transporter n=1 Tax=Nakamurella flava TaxID=2576308 RepID=UPI00140761E6|nr:MFS transporter [Nakamurella flava]